MYYDSFYYSSNYYSSGYYKGDEQPPVTSGSYFERLGQLGFTGSLADRQMKYLLSLGLNGSDADRTALRMTQLGYQITTAEKLQQKAITEGFSSSSDMMNKIGLIPNA